MVPICVYVRGFEGRVASLGFWRASLSENSSQNSTMDNVPLLRQEAGAALYSEPIISSRKMSASESRFPPCRRPGEREKGLDPGWRKAAILSWHSGPGGGGSKPVGE